MIPPSYLYKMHFAVWDIPPLPHDFNVFWHGPQFFKLSPYLFYQRTGKKYILAPGKPRLRARVPEGCIVTPVNKPQEKEENETFPGSEGFAHEEKLDIQIWIDCICAW